MPVSGGAWEWKDLNQEDWNQPQSEDFRGERLVAFVSPYDVPEAVRGYYDEGKKTFAIELKYIGGDETLRSAAKDETVTLWIGRDSKRLYRIDLKGGSQEPKWMVQVLPEVDEAIDELANEPQLPPRTDNYELARRIFRKVSTNPSTPFGQLPEPT